MKKQLLYLIISFFLGLNSFAVSDTVKNHLHPVNDGPYVFNMDGSFKVKWISDNKLQEDFIKPENFTEIKNKFNFLFDYKDLTNYSLAQSNYSQRYRKIDSLSVISDVHGKYDIYLNLLKAAGIIDKNLNWKYGKGHLVVLGDIFDRGDKVTEILWHVFGLEKQAAKAGGMVHLVLGNHEIMVLGQDTRYINEKYRKVEGLAQTGYTDLYSGNSVLGKWLSSKPAVITINNILFVHAGISIGVVQRNLNIAEINKIFAGQIVGKNPKDNMDNEEAMFLDSDYGPVWYRGYFNDPDFNEARLDTILNFYGKKQIVVGHTTFKDIKILYNNKVIGIDSGIMNGLEGAILMNKNGIFYKVSSTGIRTRL